MQLRSPSRLAAIAAVLLHVGTAVHHARHGADSYAGVQHSLDEMVERSAAAEARLGEAARYLEEALLGAAPNATLAKSNTTLRGTRKLPANLSATLKVQQDKLGQLFSHLKSNIAEFNKRESDQKKDSSVFAERLKKRLEEDKKRLKDPSLSAFDREMLVNRTRTEEHEMKFWTTGRSLQHDMFHSNLKLTHGLMSRVKTIMDAYKQVMVTGKLDSKLTKVLHETSASMGHPKAFVQREQRVNRSVRKLKKHLQISAKLLGQA